VTTTSEVRWRRNKVGRSGTFTTGRLHSTLAHHHHHPSIPTIMSKQNTKPSPVPKSHVLDTFKPELFKGKVIFTTGG
jgi:hypothetical protein